MNEVAKISTAKELFSQDNVKGKFQELLGKKAQGFITSVLQIVASNSMLVNADPYSVYNAAALAATLDLPLNNNLGFAYIVPYKNLAQFQLGYRGFIQLAQRTGLFQTIAACPIYEGQIVEANPLTGYKFDFTKRDSDKIIGYAGFFKLLNGFEKTLYMTKEELNKHGKAYSQTYKKGMGLWETNFDAMATKTVIKLLLSKFAPLSIEMQRAVITDQAVINDVDTDDVTYVDNDLRSLEEAPTVEELKALFDEVAPELGKKEFDDATRIITNKEEASYKKLKELLTPKRNDQDKQA
jgi:recombination protein RecT